MSLYVTRMGEGRLAVGSAVRMKRRWKFRLERKVVGVPILECEV